MLTKADLMVKAMEYVFSDENNREADASWKNLLETAEVEPDAEEMRKELLAVMNGESL